MNPLEGFPLLALMTALGLGLLLPAAPAQAAACGQPPIGEPAGSVTVESFIERVTSEHAAIERVELATFGLG